MIARGAKLRWVATPKLEPEPQYRPSTALDEFVRSRDMTCRAAGCDRPAMHADIDHTVAYPAGPTHPGNLKCYCRILVQSNAVRQFRCDDDIWGCTWFVPYHEGLPLNPCWRPIMTQLATSLYQRMGGYDVIAAVIDDLFAILRSDPAFARFFGGRSNDSAVRSRQLLVDQMCALSGGPCNYIGRDMKTSHSGLGITDVEWETNMKASDAALAKNGVGDAERADFLALFERYRDDIVEAN